MSKIETMREKFDRITYIQGVLLQYATTYLKGECEVISTPNLPQDRLYLCDMEGQVWVAQIGDRRPRMQRLSDDHPVAHKAKNEARLRLVLHGFPNLTNDAKNDYIAEANHYFEKGWRMAPQQPGYSRTLKNPFSCVILHRDNPRAVMELMADKSVHARWGSLAIF